MSMRTAGAAATAEVRFAEPEHGQIVVAALKEFHEALTRRWREKLCEEVVHGRHDYPVVIRRETSPHSHQPLWEYWSRPAREHLRFPGQCAFVSWVESGQNGSLSGVTCDGATGTSEDVEVVGPGGEMVVVPPYIECGMGSVLAQVEDWAWGEREHLFYRLPLYDHQDVRALQAAHDDLIDIGRHLVLKPESGSEFDPGSAGDLDNIVSDITGKNDVGLHWWAGWTGLAASRARSNFFDSCGPTIENQSGLAGSLANLYSDRAALIIAGRNNTLRLIQAATEALGEKVTTPRADDWKVVQNIGAGIATAFGWTGKGAVLGAAVFLVGFLGSNLDKGTRTVGYAGDIAELVGQLNDDVDALSAQLDSDELDYLQAASRLRRNLFEVHSFELELYDLTRNDADGDRQERDLSDSGFSADVSSILNIAEGCYNAGNGYGELVPTIAATSEADRHLADKDGNQTDGDMAVMQLRDQLEGFLKTTCGRYLLAGDQVKQAADDYVEVDESQREKFDETVRDWTDDDGNSIADYDSAINPGKYAQETDRSGYDPYEGHPALGGGQPGANADVAPGSGTDVEYVIEDEGR